MKFSIITVTYNCLEGFKKTHDSIVAQTGVDIEYIVVDGASTDGTKEAIAASLHITKWVSEKDGGIYDAMNKGLDMATGDVVIFMNAADYFVGDLLKKIKVVPCLIPGRYEIIPGVEVNMLKKSPLLGTPYCHQCYVFPLKKEIKHDLSYRVAADYDFIIRHKLDSIEFAMSPEEGYISWDNTGFSVSNAKLRDQEIALIMSKYYGSFYSALFSGWAKLKRGVRKVVVRSPGLSR